jgi:saccharopine dehydrogenase-like NADP-dependent oxidoreductase
MKKLAILGLGHIGQYVFDTLSNDKNFEVRGFDLKTGHDLTNTELLKEVIGWSDGVLASTPYFLNKIIAGICNDLGKDYFDLTESVEVTDYVKTLKNARFITQCGLAPGMVSIIANDLAQKLDTVKDIEIRVGALPENASNHMTYYRTWNTEGLINEYIHPCPALKDGKLVYLDPLADLEHIMLNGAKLEAANTSGGLGSLAESYIGRATNVNYKTLRYPGHWKLMSFLKDDLGLKNNFDTYVKLFNQNVPQTDKDFIFILINVSGTLNNQYVIRQYSKIIESKNKETAIQRSTAGGAMAVIDSWAQGYMDHKKGWIRQEELEYSSVWNSKYSSCYH